MNWVVLRFPCDMKTAARAEKVLEQLNKGLPPEVREPGTPENSMQPISIRSLSKLIEHTRMCGQIDVKCRLRL
jgi:hypothetical protein